MDLLVAIPDAWTGKQRVLGSNSDPSVNVVLSLYPVHLRMLFSRPSLNSAPLN